MDEICLSQGNSNRLRELGLVEAATVVLLPKVRFNVENETLQGERKNVCMTLREVLAAMPGVSDNEVYDKYLVASPGASGLLIWGIRVYSIWSCKLSLSSSCSSEMPKAMSTEPKPRRATRTRALKM